MSYSKVDIEKSLQDLKSNERTKQSMALRLRKILIRRYSFFSVMFIILLTLLNGGSPASSKSNLTSHDTSIAYEIRTNSSVSVWKRSSVWTGSESGPTDNNSNSWSSQAFDDSQWTTLSLPDFAPDQTGNNDRYYRGKFIWDGGSPVTIRFASDDGLRIYINGSLLGGWGQAWRTPGCINVDYCGDNSVPVQDQTIPPSMLKPGENTVAIDVWNAAFNGPNYYYLDVVITTDQKLFSPGVKDLFQNASKSSAAANAAITLVVARCASIPVVTRQCAVLGLVGALMGITGLGLDQLADDPPDPNFTTIAQPVALIAYTPPI